MTYDEELTAPSRPSISPPDELAAAIKTVLREMRLLYSVPRQVRNNDDSTAYLALLSQAMTDETQNADLIIAGWREFKRTHGRGFWPTPGELCASFRRERRDREELALIPQARRMPWPDYRRPELVTRATRAETLAALATADSMANSDNATARHLGKALTTLGLAIIARNGDPR